jgi:hypothetical protein
MKDEARPTPSALQAWASGVMAGSDSGAEDQVGELDRAPGQAQYDPADVISVYMGARESAKERHRKAPAPVSRIRRRGQPS